MPGSKSTAAGRGRNRVPAVSPTAYAAVAALALAVAGIVALLTADARPLAAPAFAGTFLLIAVGLGATGRYVAAGATTVAGGAFVLSLGVGVDTGPGVDSALAAVIVASATVAVWSLERHTGADE